MTNPLTELELAACWAAMKTCPFSASLDPTKYTEFVWAAALDYLRAELAKEEPVAYLGILAEDGCKTLEWKPHDVEHLDGDQYLPLYLRPCCHEYATCLRACTPRGEWIAQQRMKG